ncbi:MAG TPA: hypothetical protein VFV98_06930 [Vicinamibacterales bacterium]|nr:hypothetical protein [Vicinamibacterales bacterium]
MSWIDAPGVERRPLVIVEDHLHHAGELVESIAAARPQLVSQVTLCAIDRAGPDTDASVREWLLAYPELQVASLMSAGAIDDAARDRAIRIDAGDLADAASFGRLVARLLRPGGVLVQDVQLSTLPFVPADRWWESIYSAATVRGILSARPPVVRFLSNKRGYSATFGRELMDAGFDPRDVMDKGDLAAVVIPTLVSTLERQFRLRLCGRLGGDPAREWMVAADDGERRDVERAFDLVLWPAPGGVEIGGRLVAGGRLAIKPGSHEGVTWRALIDDRLDGGAGLAVTSVGERIGPPHAERAELTNLAARHIHTLRGRLTDGEAIVTANHAYRLRDGRWGRVI